MKINDNGIVLTDWSEIDQELASAISGISKFQKIEYGDKRIRLVKYSSGYELDHWCTKGHIIYVLEGRISVKLKDETVYTVEKGMSFICGDNNVNPHMVISKGGAKLLIID